MNPSKTNRKDNFQEQVKKFKALLFGSTMAKVSTIILILLSLKFAYESRENIIVAGCLLFGAMILTVYIIKFLSLKNIKQKAYTQTSLTSSFSKFKTYISYRKKYEMYFMTAWTLTYIPFVLTQSTNFTATVIGVILYFSFIYIFGLLAFKKIDSDIAGLEDAIKDGFSENQLDTSNL